MLLKPTVHIKQWQRLARLALLMTLLTLCVQSSEAQSVSPDHPRLWLTPDRLVRLRGLATKNTALWQGVKAYADSNVAIPASSITASNADIEAIPALGLAYQVTQNPAYSQQAINNMVAICSSNDYLYHTEVDNNSFSYRWTCADLAAGLDWCYDRMSDAQRKLVAKFLMDLADFAWPATNPSRQNAWAVNDPTNNYFWGMMETWPAALAADGDDPRAGNHLVLALARHNNLIAPFAQTWGSGGIFAEGTNYDSMFDVGRVYDAVLTATGQDFVNDANFPLLRNSLLWRIHSTSPGLLNEYYLGDQSRASSAPLWDLDFMRGLVPAADTMYSPLAAVGQSWLNSVEASGVDKGLSFDVTWEFLFYNPDAPTQDYTTLPTTFFDPGTGVYVRRTDWGPDATYWGTWCGPLIASHQFSDVNGFNIWKGNSWLTGSSNMWAYSGIQNETQYQNNMTFNGVQYQQQYQAPDATWPDQAGRIVNNETTPEYTYFAGQSAQAYTQDRSHGGTRVVNDCVRKTVYLNPSLFIVYDRVALVDPSLTKDWHLQSQTPITINGTSYSFDNGQYQLNGKTLLPAPGAALSVDPINQAYNGQSVSSYRLNVVSSNPVPTDYLLNVMQILPKGQTVPYKPSLIPVTTANMDGALCGSWAVLIGKTDLVTGEVDYSVSSGGSLQHLLVDLIPNSHYTVTVVDQATHATSTLTPAATSSGSLRFSTTGSVHVTVKNIDPVPFSISGRVMTQNGPLWGATVTDGVQTATTDGSGLYTLTPVSSGTYTISVSKPGYRFSLPRQVTLGPSRSGINFLASTSGTSWQISCGPYGYTSQTAGVWLRDCDFNGGSERYYGDLVVQGSPDADLYRWMRSDSSTFSYSLPAVAGNYLLKLHFVEPDPQGNTPGYRRFNVSVNGQQILNNFDISAAAGGVGKVIVESLPVTPNSDGFNITFQAFTGSAIVSAIELVPDDGIGNTLFSIAGTVTLNGSGLNNVTITAGGQSATTVSDGTYTLGGLAAGTYAVSASLSGYALSGSQSVTVGPNKNGVNFTATQSAPTTFSISGTVTSQGAALAGATVSAAGQSATTASDGSYQFSKLTAGSYSVSAALSGYVVSAPQSVTVGPSKSGINFSAAAVAAPSSVLRVNCGGGAYTDGAGAAWRADAGFSGGAAWRFPAAGLAGTPDPALYGTVRYDDAAFGYRLPAPAGAYTLRLHFVEGDASKAAPGTRVFDVAVNGAPALTRLDVCAAAGGVGRPLVESLPVTSDGGGVAVAFTARASSAMVSAIELVPASAPPPVSLRVNCGGGAYTDGAGAAWRADAGFSGGAAWRFPAAGLAGTPDPALYGTVRYDDAAFGYRLPAPAGAYTLRLHFVEGDASKAAPGTRVFDVAVNGAPALTRLDVCAAAGGVGRPLVESLPVTSDGGGVAVAFTARASSAMVSAIELVPASAPPPVSLRVNCGGGAYTDGAGAAWRADAGFSGGAAWRFPAAGLAGTPDPALYGTVRYDDAAFGYRLPAPAGAYTLRLHFVEGDASKAAPGTRVFDVAVNGAPALTRLDVCAAAGGVGRPLVESLPVTSDGGGVAVAFTARASSAMVSAIELVPADGTTK